MAKKERIKRFLEENRGYLKWGKKKLARKFDISPFEISEIKREITSQPLNREGFKRLFFDIETSFDIGWFWRSGFNQTITTDQIIKERAVICVSYKWAGEDQVYNLKWDENQCDKKLLKEFSKVMQEADEVIAHNGDRFDVKWLRTRCLIHRVPFPTYVKSLDTLRKVKSMFNFQSNKLDYIAEVLGFGNKLPTGIDLWKDITFNKCEKAMKTMVEYCNHDVILLEDVYNAIENYIKPNTHVGVHQGKGKHTCPKCGSEDITYVKSTVTASGTVKRVMSCFKHGDYVISNTAYKKYLEEKDGN